MKHQTLFILAGFMGLSMLASCASRPVATPSPSEASSTHKINRPSPQFNTAPHSDPSAARQSPVFPGASFGLYGQIQPVGGAPVVGDAAPDNLRQVTFTTEGSDFDINLDPSGKWLLFASTRHRQTSSIYMQRADGATATQLTDGPANDAMPVFSPDGKKIAFCSDRSGNWDIYTLTLDGGQPVQFTSDSAHDIHPSFSPDGGKLVYCTQSAQTGLWEMVVVELDKPGVKHFIGQGLFPNWSPAGDKIVFQKARERGTRWFSVWTVDYQNGEGSKPTEIVASSNAACITPDFSPDGKQIVFCTVVDPQDPAQPNVGPRQADVWSVRMDGSNRTNLTHNRNINVRPVWSKNGLIYFGAAAGDNRSQNIWALRSDGASHPTAPATASTTPKPSTPKSHEVATGDE